MRRVATVASAFVLCMVTIGSAGATSAATAVRWSVDVPNRSRAVGLPPVAYGDGELVVTRPGGITAYAANNGFRLWYRPGDSGGVIAHGIVFTNGTADRSGDPGALVALDARNGRELWRRRAAGGAIAADDTSVVVGSGDRILSFTRDGSLQWTLPRPGHFYRVLLEGAYVVALSAPAGAIAHGEIDTVARRTGRFIDSAGFDRLVESSSTHALGQLEYHDDRSCSQAELVDVPFERAAVSRTTYVLDSTPPEKQPQCSADRYGDLYVGSDGRLVAVISGNVLGLFDRSRPTVPENVYGNASLVGGPFGGYLYIARPHGLDALGYEAGRATWLPLLAQPAATFAVTGVGDRLYVSDGTRTYAFDPAHFEKPPLLILGLACTQLAGISRSGSFDVLECGSGSGGESSKLVGVSWR